MNPAAPGSQIELKVKYRNDAFVCNKVIPRRALKFVLENLLGDVIPSEAPAICLLCEGPNVHVYEF